MSPTPPRDALAMSLGARSAQKTCNKSEPAALQLAEDDGPGPVLTLVRERASERQPGVLSAWCTRPMRIIHTTPPDGEPGRVL